MRLFNAPAAMLGLLAIAYLPSAIAKPYPAHIEEFRQAHNAPQLEKRITCAAGQTQCGYYGLLCCGAGQQCITDANNQAQCAGGNGGWQYFTTTYVETVGLVTYTSVFSSYVGGAAATTATCTGVRSPCGTNCCDGGFYCNVNQQCVMYGGGSSGGILPTVPGTLAPSAPLRPTNSGLVIVTFTGSPTRTAPFQTPIPTGVNGAPVPVESGGGGLSGGAIAGIVIGVILGILLLLLLCLFCCARALFDTILAIFGIGKKNKHTHEETYVEEHHHSSGGAAAGGGRWYGQGRPSRPSRPGSEKKSGIGKGVGVAAALGGLALMLGLKKKHDKRHDDKSTTVSGSSYYYSDYTSSSSASSSDRRTRNTRHSSRR
ncbi:hypothetical protein FB567DRAFT_559445 [Paraphoma chrysanthemicola]|uniref:Uncharacterized protein n=1 Tax=Paraphoma chrysanthemicola TaxID=798071 RepID=A0A8K0RAJ8_9PLEO|nr:hypothetical protein FB567DRAFT_559445 [Paraphoma chrysanthemicola]